MTHSAMDVSLRDKPLPLPGDLAAGEMVCAGGEGGQGGRWRLMLRAGAVGGQDVFAGQGHDEWWEGEHSAQGGGVREWL